MFITMRRAFKYAVNRNKISADMMTQQMKTFGCVRKLYNLELDWLYNVKLPSIGYVSGSLEDISFPEVTTFKKQEQYHYLKEVDSLALCNAKIAAERSLQHFREQADHTEYRKGAILRCERDHTALTPQDLKGSPVFRSKARGDYSYTTNNQLAGGSLKEDTIRLLPGSLLHLPKMKKGQGLPLIMHRPLPAGAVIKNVTVSMTLSGDMYASIYTEYPAEMDLSVRRAAIADDNSVIERLSFLGLDYAQKDFYVSSEGKTANYPHFYRKSEDRLCKLQKQLSRMTKGSGNYQRKKLQISRLSAHIANQRRDFCQKLSTSLVNRYDVIVVEDINLRAMGGALSLGKNLHDNGFGMFRTMLSYKLDRKDSCLVKVDRSFPSTKTCHCCGAVNREIVLGVQEWDCPSCGVHLNRDENAAINIREEGKRIFFEFFREYMTKQDRSADKADKLHQARTRKGSTSKTKQGAA